MEQEQLSPVVAKFRQGGMTELRIAQLQGMIAQLNLKYIDPTKILVDLPAGPVPSRKPTKYRSIDDPGEYGGN